jgi:hypothetical protein
MNKLMILLIVFPLLSCGTADKSSDRTAEVKQEKRIRLVRNDDEKKIDVFIDKQYFTSYMYPESIKKPVLFPLNTASGTTLTRGFPLDPQPWERIDHPHHVGMWLNHGDTNGLDFWNNSDSIPANRRPHYGTIFHKTIKEVKSGDEFGYLEVRAEWERPDGRVLLNENTQYYFRGQENVRIIDRITTLTATDLNVLFTDSKEGMMGIRVNRAMELPEDNTIEVINEEGVPVEVNADEGNRSRGHYLNSEGIVGGDVWGKRARWVRLGSDIGGEDVGIIIMDHPDNPNHPTHWHARGYGLFSANPFGSQAYTNGKETFNFFLPVKESVTLKYRVYIYNGNMPDETAVNAEYEKFVNSYKN